MGDQVTVKLGDQSELLAADLRKRLIARSVERIVFERIGVQDEAGRLSGVSLYLCPTPDGYLVMTNRGDGITEIVADEGWLHRVATIRPPDVRTAVVVTEEQP